MNILLVTALAGRGGTENATLRLAVLLRKNGHHVTIASNIGSMAKDFSENGINLVDIDFYKGKFNCFLNFFILLRHFIFNDYDVIHSQMARPVVFFWAASFLTRNGAVCWHSRGLWQKTYKWICPLFSLLKIYSIGNCKHERDKLIRYGMNESMVGFTYNAMPKIKYIDESFKPRRRIGDTLVVGTISRLEEDRRVDIAIKSVAAAIDLGVDIKLRVAGSGSELNKLKDLCSKLNVMDKVEFLGEISNTRCFYGSIDMLLSTAIALGDNGAGVGNNIIESGIHSLPVISFNICGVSELIVDGQSGVCVNDQNEIAYINEFVSFSKKSSEELVAIGTNLHKIVTTKCSDQSIYETTMMNYNKAISASGG